MYRTCIFVTNTKIWMGKDLPNDMLHNKTEVSDALMLD